MPTRPKNEKELQLREAIGVIRASRFIRKYAHAHKLINFETVCAIHKEIFKDAWPEVAGKYRTENLEITDSNHLPPHYSKVLGEIKRANIELVNRLSQLKTVESFFLDSKEMTVEVIDSVDKIIKVVAWLHHKITFIHPFREGNGRTARLAANLILERYGLVGISIKIEKENKNKYRQALAQVDRADDYEPLEGLIYEGLIDRYNGVGMKYYEVK